MKHPSAQITLLLQMLDEAFVQKAWHGPNLRGAIHGLSPQQAGWRPSGLRHCIAEIVVHCAYWKYAGRRRLLGEKRGSFAIKGSNWFKLPPNLTAAEWKGYVALLDQEHGLLRQAVANLSPARLNQVPKGSRITNLNLLYGLALHDTYHAGQIRLLKAMQKHL